jgi:hypothetical protein
MTHKAGKSQLRKTRKEKGPEETVSGRVFIIRKRDGGRGL